MNAKVNSVSASLRLHYHVSDDLLYEGNVAVSEDHFFSDWVLGTKNHAVDSLLKLLAKAGDDELIVFGVVPAPMRDKALAAEKSQEADTETLSKEDGTSPS